MKILLFDASGFTCHDLKNELDKQGYSVNNMYYHFKDRYNDIFFLERLILKLQREKFDVVISVNFFPLIAKACNDNGIVYISWSYDSPLDEQLTQYFNYETNRIFLFDREEVYELNQKGFSNVFHLPLAVSSCRLESLGLHSITKFESDISFVGRIYESNIDALLYPASDYVKGYVEGLFQAQLRIYGCNFLEKTIPEHVIDSLNDSYSKIGQNNVKLTKRGLAYEISTQITNFERSFLLNEFAEIYDVHLYTANKCELSDKVNVHGPVKYFDEMNQVFVSSKLNLCPTLKSIASGIPLRALDIMGAGGVLFSNYQPELAEYFVDGQDVIMYESIEDAFAKAEFYLKNDQLLCKIAENGHEIVKEHFDYKDRIEKMLKVI